MKNKVRPIDANALAKRIREYMDNFPYAGTRLATCRVVLSMLGDEGQTPTLTDHFPDLTNMIPLTLEQLREMDGEPVWVVLTNEKWSRLNGWYLVHRGSAYLARIDDWELDAEEYGVEWLAYRRPPEGEED